MAIHLRPGGPELVPFLNQLKVSLEEDCPVRANVYTYPYSAIEAVAIASADKAEAIIYVTEDDSFQPNNLFDNDKCFVADYTYMMHTIEKRKKLTVAYKPFGSDLSCVAPILLKFTVIDSF